MTTLDLRNGPYSTAGNVFAGVILTCLLTTANATPPAAPTALGVAAVSSTSVVLYWTDCSNDETGFEIQYYYGGSWTSFGTVAANSVGYGLTTPASFSATWRVRSVKGSEYSAFTPEVSCNQGATFNVPTNFQAVAQGADIVIAWGDNATTEDVYEIQTRQLPSGSFAILGTVSANYPLISLSGYLTPGVSYEIKVRGRKGTSSYSYTGFSNVATATVPDAFTSRTYEPITYNQPFTYQATVSTGSSRTSWSITGYPSGLSFNSSTGVLSGTPTVTGVFVCPMTATFASGWTTNSTLTLRIIRAPGAPVAGTTITTQTMANGGNTSIALTDKFTDPDAESAVRLVTNMGTMDFILYNTATPQTVTNFLSYVNNASSSGNYNGAVFHRSMAGFVVQGGGFKVQSAPNYFTAIATTASPTNEPGISSLRGTVAMAKVGSDPNSATDQFFVNLADNSTNLDNQNGGFTVFARVAGNGMTTADSIAALPTVNSTVYVDGSATTSLTDWPLTSSSASMDTSKVVSITSAAPVAVLSYSVTGNSNPAAVSANINGTNLQINGLAGGQSNVTVTATDLDGNTVAQTFTVNVNQAPAFTSSLPTSPAVKDAAYSFVCTASGFPVPSFAVTAGTLPPGLNLESNGAITGSPIAAGTFTGTITASSTAGSATQDFSITVNQTPAFTSSQPTGTAMVGSAYSFTCTASGVPSPTFSVTAGSLPTGLALAANGAITGTPSVGGAFTGTVTATNAAGSATQNFSVTVTASLDSWAASKGLTGNDALVDADPDHDGRTNLMEFAFMSDPTASEGGDGPSYDLASSSDLKYGEITFPVRKFAPTLTYKVEVSDSLTSGSWSTLWSSAGGFGSPYSTVEQADCTWVTVRDTEPSPPATRRFLRVTVSQP